MSDGKNRYHRLNLLLVDDERGYVDVLVRRLGRRGIQVVSAACGTEGIQKLRDQRFNIAVVDLKMEDMDGIEVLKIFKKMDPQMPVIILTGHGSEQAARDGMAHGAHDYLTKPCDLQELLEKIYRAAEQGR